LKSLRDWVVFRLRFGGITGSAGSQSVMLT
jgi:hypothetical protein